MGRHFSARKINGFSVTLTGIIFCTLCLLVPWAGQHALRDCAEHFIKTKNEVNCSNQILSGINFYLNSLNEENIFSLSLHFFLLDFVTLNVVAPTKPQTQSNQAKSLASITLLK